MGGEEYYKHASLAIQLSGSVTDRVNSKHVITWSHVTGAFPSLVSSTSHWYVKEREPHDYAKFQSASAMTLQSTATHITMPHSILTAVRAGQLSHVTVESCHT
mmetsp:Transcript_59963/g.87837  ORF Transcript_59963/g.87837 Transcript_59963/m.87837 type:complete len:103 (-) Transcript_59963:9-317(-)